MLWPWTGLGYTLFLYSDISLWKWEWPGFCSYLIYSCYIKVAYSRGHADAMRTHECWYRFVSIWIEDVSCLCKSLIGLIITGFNLVSEAWTRGHAFDTRSSNWKLQVNAKSWLSRTGGFWICSCYASKSIGPVVLNLKRIGISTDLPISNTCS